MTTSEGFGSTFAPGSTGVTTGKSASQWSAPAEDTSTSTTDVAKDQASSVAGGAADAAKNVAGTAKEQATQVAGEAKKQVKDLVGQARGELTDQASVQQQRIAGGLRSVADQIRSMADGSGEQSPATDIAHQAADKAHEVAAFFENRDPGSVLEEVRSFARRQPGVFLALSLGAGVLVGRIARGIAADSGDAAGAATPTPAAGHGAVTSGHAAPSALSGLSTGTAGYTVPANGTSYGVTGNGFGEAR